MIHQKQEEPSEKKSENNENMFRVIQQMDEKSKRKVSRQETNTVL